MFNGLQRAVQGPCRQLQRAGPWIGGSAGAALVLAALLSSGTVLAETADNPPISLYGMPGLIDMPGARMLKDGTFALTAETKQPDDRITIDFQALPWLEATARYSVIYGFNGRENGPLYDRSLGVKVRLLPEGHYNPALSIGVLDFGGTLVYGGEYIAAAKRYGPFDVNLGLGFGRLGSRGQFSNPLGLISDSFYTRKNLHGTGVTQTGQPQFSSLFHGKDVAIYGGLIYDTPIDGLKAIVEYSGDKYVVEQQKHILDVKSAVNFGLSYRPWPFLEGGVYWTYGSELALRLSLLSDLKSKYSGYKLDPAPLPVKIRDEETNERAQLSRDLGLDNSSGSAKDAAAAGNGIDKPFSEPLSDPPDTDLPAFDSRAPFPLLLASASTYGPTERQANSSVIEAIRQQLGALGFTLDDVQFEDTQVVFSISSTGTNALFSCDALWREVSTTGLVGVDTITFITSHSDAESNRCTKFINMQEMIAGAGPSPRPAPGAAAPSGGASSAAAPPKSEKDIAKAVAAIFRQQRLLLDTMNISGSEVTVYFINNSYQRVGFAIGRAARALTQVLPDNIELLTLIETTGDLNGAEYRIPRSELERIAATSGSPEEILASTVVEPAKPGRPENPTYSLNHFMRFYPALGPGYRESLFDPDNPMAFQIYLNTGGTLELTRGLTIDGYYQINLYNDFDTLRRGSNSLLPHVRSDFRQYLTEGASGMSLLQLTAIRQITPEVTFRLSAGYLEDMFGGVAGEMLYAPFDSRWAIGGEIAQVWQRDFDRGFGFQHYNVVTGHISLYYQTPFHNYNLALHVGRYLAKDYGATFEVSRRFNNGAEVGVWATFTNVPFSKFGEGSFDKGIKLVIPLDFMSFFSTREAATFVLRPLTRDGGAMLADGPQLYPPVRSISYGEAYRTWDDFLDER